MIVIDTLIRDQVLDDKRVHTHSHGYRRPPTAISTTNIPWAHIDVTTWSDRSVTTAVSSGP